MAFKPKVRTSVSHTILQFVHAQLDLMGLSVESIERQNLDALEKSLSRVDECINHPESFRSLCIKQSRHRGYYFSYSGLDISFDAVVRPILLNRKKLITGRLETLKLDDGIQSLSNSIKEIDNEGSQLGLTDKIKGLRISSQTLGEQLIEVSKEQEQLCIQMERERLNIFEGKFKMFLSLLEKEAAATIIGVFFLIIASLIWLAEMFTSVAAPSVLKDCLFLVFGYFFGQASTQSSHAE